MVDSIRHSIIPFAAGTKVCDCPNGSYVNRKTGDTLISSDRKNHAVNCRIRKNIQTEDEYLVTDSNRNSGCQVTNASYTVFGEW